MQEIPVILYIQYNFNPANLIKSYPPSSKTDTRNMVSWATSTLSLHGVVDSRMLEQILGTINYFITRQSSILLNYDALFKNYNLF